MSVPAQESADLQRRFGGLQRLYGVAGAQRIRAAHVAVIGIGGVGSWAAEALARSGVGRLTLIDMDHVAESNVNRQIHALSTTLGQAKVRAMAERIPGARFEIIPDAGHIPGVEQPAVVARLIGDFLTETGFLKETAHA